MTAKLLTRDGGLVTEFPMPPFQLLPEVAVWGQRIFVLREPFAQRPGQPARPVYWEAYGWSVDASKIFEAEHGSEVTREVMREAGNLSEVPKP